MKIFDILGIFFIKDLTCEEYISKLVHFMNCFHINYSKQYTKSKFPLQQVFVISKPGTLTN